MSDHRNSTAVPVVSIGGTEIRPLTYKGARIITTELLAKEFGATEKNLHDNFGNNQTRFAEQVHFFRVSGDELRALKNSPDFIGVVKANTPSLILWTERGVFRHAKILETDQAWEAYERLEDVYFAVREAATAIPTTAEALAQVFRMVADSERAMAQQAAFNAQMAERVEMVEQTAPLKAKPQNAETRSEVRKRMNRVYGLSEPIVDTVLDHAGYGIRPFAMVKNSHEDAQGSSYGVYWIRDISALFKRFASECTPHSSTMVRHPIISRPFKLSKIG